MDVFHVFKIVQMVQNRAMHHKSTMLLILKNYPLAEIPYHWLDSITAKVFKNIKPE